MIASSSALASSPLLGANSGPPRAMARSTACAATCAGCTSSIATEECSPNSSACAHSRAANAAQRIRSDTGTSSHPRPRRWTHGTNATGRTRSSNARLMRYAQRKSRSIASTSRATGVLEIARSAVCARHTRNRNATANATSPRFGARPPRTRAGSGHRTGPTGNAAQTASGARIDPAASGNTKMGNSTGLTSFMA